MEALSVRHIVKKFPNVVANDDVSISIEKEKYSQLLAKTVLASLL